MHINSVISIIFVLVYFLIGLLVYVNANVVDDIVRLSYAVRLEFKIRLLISYTCQLSRFGALII